jgi:hypothetical protein
VANLQSLIWIAFRQHSRERIEVEFR